MLDTPTGLPDSSESTIGAIDVCVGSSIVRPVCNEQILITWQRLKRPEIRYVGKQVDDNSVNGPDVQDPIALELRSPS